MNGRPLEVSADPDRYLAIRRSWRTGIRSQSACRWNCGKSFLQGDDSVAAALYGPLVLAADLGAGPADGPLRVIHGRPTEPGTFRNPILCQKVATTHRLMPTNGSRQSPPQTSLHRCRRKQKAHSYSRVRDRKPALLRVLAVCKPQEGKQPAYRPHGCGLRSLSAALTVLALVFQNRAFLV